LCRRPPRGPEFGDFGRLRDGLRGVGANRYDMRKSGRRRAVVMKQG
jgi:hypothetical protein